MDSSKRVLVSIVTHNANTRIGSVLYSVFNQTYPHVDIVVSDNGSSDDTLSNPTVKSYIPPASIIINDNIGFGRAQNNIINSAKTPYILLMNDDVYLDDNYIENCLNYFKNTDSQKRLAGVTGKLFEVSRLSQHEQNKRSIDIFSLSPSRKTVPYESAENNTICGIIAAAAFFDTNALKALSPNIFDEDFFMYYEDVDLCWRLHKKGYSVELANDAVAYHMRSYSFDKRLQVPLNIRKRVYLNRYLSIIKNENILTFIKNIPQIFYYEFIQFFYLLFKDWRSLIIYFNLIILFPKFIYKRLFVK